MDWSGWVLFGFIGTIVLTGIIVGAQLAGWTRIDMPLILGSMFTGRVDRARVIGIVAHLAMGQVFALLYAVGFHLLSRAGPLLGALFGALHGLAVLTLLLPFLPALHPRMASERSGPDLGTELEPPGLFGLNFGVATPVVTLAAHVVFGITLGVLLHPR